MDRRCADLQRQLATTQQVLLLPIFSCCTLSPLSDMARVKLFSLTRSLGFS